MADYQRPGIPYNPTEVLPNNNRYGLFSANSQPPKADDFDGDFNYIIDSLNKLEGEIQGLEAGILTGSNNPANVNKFPITDGNGTITWSQVTPNYIPNNSIPTIKIAPQAITNPLIGPAAVQRNNIAPESINDDLVQDTSLHFQVMIQENNAAFQAFFNVQNNGTLSGAKIQDNSAPPTIFPDNSIPAIKLINNSITAQQLAPAVQMPIGSVLAWPGAATVAPAGCIFARGQQDLSRVIYAALFAVYGTTYGAGDGVTTFGVPDCRGRMLAFLDMSAANTPAATNGLVTTATANALTVGGNGGEERHALTILETPSHSHTIINKVANNVQGGINGYTETPDGNTQTGNTGGDQPHNNMPPFMFMQAIIYTGV